MRADMRPAAVAILIALALIAASCQRPPDLEPLAEGKPAPKFELKDVDGNAWRLKELEGRAVVVNFWASWCAPCREELPSLQRLFEKTIDTPGLVIMTVLFKNDPMEAYSYAREMNYTFPVLVDPGGSVAAAYGLTGVPETFIIDKKGVLRKKVIGPMEFDSPYVIGYLKSLAEE